LKLRDEAKLQIKRYIFGSEGWGFKFLQVRHVGLEHLPTGDFFAAVPIKLNHSAEQIALESRARPHIFRITR